MKNGISRQMFVLLFVLNLVLVPVIAHADSLQDEFDRLCVCTQDAESLSVEKLEELVIECDQLKNKIMASDDRAKKVLLFRLEKCRNFFVYMVELKKNEK